MQQPWSGWVAGQHVEGSEVLESYWRLAAERQRVYHARVAGSELPWTDDKVVAQYRFTNAYRAADRVSQALLRVIYAGSQDPEDVVLRILLFRLFNKIETWQAVEAHVGEVTVDGFRPAMVGALMDDLLAANQRIYSAAYIMPSPPFGYIRKHRNHLALIVHMLSTQFVQRIQEADSLQSVFSIIESYPSLGPFLAYQLTIDLNYSEVIHFDEDDFVVAGPGALSGIAKCFPTARNLEPSALIRWMVDTQDDQIAYYDVDFRNLFGRPLKLIDCQNLFCETDKYARVAHPDRRGIGGRTRIKQQFKSAGALPIPFFPPKWGLRIEI